MKTNYIPAILFIIGYVILMNIITFVVVTGTNDNIIEDKFVTYDRVTMKRSDAESVLAVISAEGFDNAFNHQSSFKDIGDVKFHELRRAYIAASKELSNYLADAVGNQDSIPYYMSFEGNN